MNVIKCCLCVRAQSCPTPCYSMDCNPPDSSVHGISQARILQRVTISSSRGSSPPTVSFSRAGEFFTTSATREARYLCYYLFTVSLGLPGGASQETQVRGFDPWVGKIPWRRAWQPTPVFLSEKSHGQRGLPGYSPWDRKKVGHD